jgi:hypothetical protein
MSSKSYSLRSTVIKRKETTLTRREFKKSKSDDVDDSNFSYSSKVTSSKNSQLNNISFNLEMGSNENPFVSTVIILILIQTQQTVKIQIKL